MRNNTCFRHLLSILFFSCCRYFFVEVAFKTSSATLNVLQTQWKILGLIILLNFDFSFDNVYAIYNIKILFWLYLSQLKCKCKSSFHSSLRRTSRSWIFYTWTKFGVTAPEKRKKHDLTKSENLWANKDIKRKLLNSGRNVIWVG